MQTLNTHHVIKSLRGNSVATFSSSKLIKLILNNTEIIREEESESNYLLSGSYLCFPWVGRLTNEDKLKELTKDSFPEYHFIDENNFPLHGFYADAERKVFSSSDEGDSIAFIAECSEQFPFFIEEYKIDQYSLEIKTSFENRNGEGIQYFAYGYHPYIGINGQKINNLSLYSNIKFNVALTSQLVPEVFGNLQVMRKMREDPEDNPLIRKIDDRLFDDLFFHPEKSDSENPFVHLIDYDENLRVTVESDNSKSIRLNYFQLYTPERRNCIAIEPLTSPSNAFNIDFPNKLIQLKPKESKQGLLRISLSKVTI
jgi:aldose 1-epimerase